MDKDTGNDDNIFKEDSKSIDRLKEIIISIKNRILLKIKAFNNMNRAVKTIYLIPCKFFLLKTSLYELCKLEKKLLYKKDPFNSPNWSKFKEKKIYVKLCNSVMN